MSIPGPWNLLLEVLAPETCALCGEVREPARWCGRRMPVRGLRPWDEPHLCRPCLARLDTGPVLAAVGRDADRLNVWAATATSADVSAVVGVWKYRGVRGLGHPLGELLVRGLGRHEKRPPADGWLVPVPLHRSRRRDRGFNQSEVLAWRAVRAGGTAVRTDLLRRVRATTQQASLEDPAARADNLAGAFACRRFAGAGAPPLVLVDDLVTSGATVLSAAAALRGAGWRVAGVVALAAALAGLAGGRVDSVGHPA